MTVHEAAPPGTLADLLQQLEHLDDEDLASALGDVEADLRAVYARRAAVIAVVHDRIHEMGHRVSGAVATVAAITVTSARSAGYLMDTSLGIVDRPAVWTALADGTIDHTRAQVIVDGLIQLDDPDRGLLEAKALTYAAGHTAHQTRRYVARLLVDHRPDLVDDHDEKERAKAWDRRHLAVFARAHGMVDLTGYLPAGTAQILLAALDQIAGTYDDDRTHDQKRVDALAQILAANTRIDVHVDVVIPADTLARLRNTGASITGFGPVDADHARALALSKDARWQLLITDPTTGQLIDMSTKGLPDPRPDQKSRPGPRPALPLPRLHHPAAHTDTDHLIPWPTGQTTPTNLAPECRGHHLIKTHSGWTCQTHPDGSLTWTSPLGTQHTTYPWNYNNPEA
ncbi:MAG: DUF222 domain-containing protein [Micrococcales bacterium]|nr:DUF222 domain-containing protein [Micrococcales bacterium]